MFAAARPSTSRLLANPANFRGLASSSRALAAAKGKAPKSGVAPRKKAANASFSKKPAAAPGGSGGGGSSKGGSISLVYSEARQVVDLSEWPKLFPEIMDPSSLGKPTTLSPTTFASLKQFGLPRRLDKELSDPSGPASVIRQCTIDLAKRLDSIREGAVEKGKSSLAITGQKGSGKSMLLLQTVAHALNSGWIVLYVPRCSEWTNSSSAYNYHPLSSTFHQPALASSLLSKLLEVNAENLEGLTTSQSHKMDGEPDVESGTKLVDFIRLGMRADVPRAAVGVLEGVMAELSSQAEIPFLIALDEVQSLYTRSRYLTPTAAPLESYHLTIPRLFLSYISSSAPTSSTLTLSAISYSTPSVPPTPTLLTALGQPTSPRNPVNAYTKLEPVHLANAEGVETYAVEVLGGKEAGGIMEIYAKKGWGGQGDEPYLTSLISSGGNAMEFGRGLGRTLSALA